MEQNLKSSDLISTESSMEFFREMVSAAFARQNIKTNEIAEFYIVNLLSEFVSVKKVYNKDGDVEDEPIAITFLKTFHSSLNEQVRNFKKVGDFSLFISGFFSDSLRDKMVDIDYYASIGKKAYSNLSLIVKNSSKSEPFFTLFHELSTNFQTFADVFSEISTISSISSNKDLLRIYERWLKTRGKRDEGLLHERGIIPIQSFPSQIRH